LLKLQSPIIPFQTITDLVRRTPTRTFRGRPTSKRAGTKSKFFGLDDQLCSVEELVLQHYSCEGWKGVHAENGVWMALLSLLFIDIIFASRDDAFHAPFQCM
jgi:Fanconi-associated nuclease 1